MAKKKNIKMLYLSAFGIIFVVLGHITGRLPGMLTLDQVFNYSSFRMPLFLFISGYFYKDENDAKALPFVIRKVRTLLIPFFVCHFFFLLLQTGLRSFGFTFGSPFSLYNLFIMPWVRVQTYTLANPSWYLIAFFISCVYYVLLRKLFSVLIRNVKVKEYVLLVFFLLLGVCCVYLRDRFQIGPAGTVYLRSAVMLFFMQLGLVYKRYWEARDTLPSWLYFAAVILLRYLVIFISAWKGYELGYGLYNFVNFRKTGLLFYVSGVLGIAFWLRIAALVAEHPRKSSVLMLIGNQTKEIMFYHLSGFFVLNLLFYAAGRFVNAIPFDKELFFSSLYYSVDLQVAAFIYLAFGISFSLLVGKGVARVKARFCSLFARRAAVENGGAP